MQESEKHIRAFEAYYASRNISKVSVELQISRQSLTKWQREFSWKLRCEERDKEISEQVQAIMTPQWVSTKTLLIQTFLNQINTAIKSGISPENSREMVAISKELRALLGEPDRHEVKNILEVQYEEPTNGDQA
jgi:hypothetical protein